jgi:hypothetical protein
MLKKRKASLELSINAIVIVVLALTLLGLGLGFIRGQFKNITDTSLKVQDAIREQILEDLRTGDRKLSFPSERLTVESNAKEDMAIGIKNTGDSSLTFKIVIEEQNPTTGEFTALTPKTNTAGGFLWDNTDQTLSLGDSRVYGILFQAKVAKDTYLYKITIKKKVGADYTDYDSKSFFVTVV